MSDSLWAGTARREITPPVGSLMACFPRGPERIPRRATGVHDPLQAKALVLSDGTTTVALCSCDLTWIRRIDVGRVRELVGRKLPALAGPNLIIAATHTHASGESIYNFGNTPDDPWVLEMDERIAAAVVEAFESREPCTMSVGGSDLELSHNRRVTNGKGGVRHMHEYCEGVTTGPTDPRLTVLRFDTTAGQFKAILFNYTAHALTVGPENLLYSADYPGAASAKIERAFPTATALFFNGAAGDIHPRICMRPNFDVMAEVGGRLGRAVIELARPEGGMERVAAVPVRWADETLAFRNRVDPSLSVSVEVSCVGLGPVVMGFVPGEVFVEYQLRFKRAVRSKYVLLTANTNGAPGYIPTTAAYDTGGYGVDLHPDDPPEYSRTSLPLGAGEIILDALIRLARRVEGDQSQ